jgi:transcriptional regulator with XRE-family HTH domain
LTQKEFAEKYKIEQRNASKYETGLSSIPDDLEALLAIDGLNLNWLTTGHGEMLVQNVENNIFQIPLLTKDHALRFDPVQEIPEPKANSGDYPDLAYIPIPQRLLEYSTDLRAIAVFDGRMYPVLKSGDIAIFEATGWNGDGIYIYRMGGVLHISYANFVDGCYSLENEIKKEIIYDAQTFKVIGRVRAVVSDLFGYDWKGGVLPPRG